MRKGAFILTVLGTLALYGCQSTHQPVASNTTTSPAAQAASARIGGQVAPPSPLNELIDRAAGPGQGWLIGARKDFVAANRVDLARKANDTAAQNPATIANVEGTPNADLNSDGFVTLDEILAMKRAGLADRRMIERIRNTPAIFSINSRQAQYLLDRGVDQDVIDAIDGLSKSSGR